MRTRGVLTLAMAVLVSSLGHPAARADEIDKVVTNLLTNPNFDSGIAGWGAGAWDPGRDADGNSASGSLFLTVTTGSGNFCTNASQCVTVSPGLYELSGKLFARTGSYAAQAHVNLLVFWDPSPNCSTGGALPNAITPDFHPATTQNSWVSVTTGPVQAPAGTHSALVTPVGCTNGPGTVGANFDDLVLQAVAGSCVPSATTLCIDDLAGDHRFAITVSFATSQSGGHSGSGQAIPLASLGVNHGGLFWFFGADNPEMLIKVLNACSLNQTYWVFFAAVTNVGFTVTVTDTITGHQKIYSNPDLQAATPVQDTGALACH